MRGRHDQPAIHALRTFWAYRIGDDALIRSQLRAIEGDLLDGTHGAIAMATSPLRLTSFGQAANEPGFAPKSGRQIAASLQRSSIRGEATLTNLASELLRVLGTLPEQTQQDLRKVLRSSNSHFSVKPNDFERVLDSWLGGTPLQYIFADLPYVLRSQRRPRIQAWLSGSSNAAGWNAEYDKFVDFIRAVFGDFLPWLMRACGRLSISTGGWATQIRWVQWASELERRIDPP